MRPNVQPSTTSPRWVHARPRRTVSHGQPPNKRVRIKGRARGPFPRRHRHPSKCWKRRRPRRCWRACTAPVHAALNQTVACIKSMPRALPSWRGESPNCGVPKYEIRPAVLVPGRPMAAADTPRRPLPGLCVVTVVTHTAPSPPENGWLSGEPLRKVPSQDRRHGAVVPSSAGCLAGRPL